MLYPCVYINICLRILFVQRSSFHVFLISKVWKGQLNPYVVHCWRDLGCLCWARLWLPPMTTPCLEWATKITRAALWFPFETQYSLHVVARPALDLITPEFLLVWSVIWVNKSSHTFMTLSLTPLNTSSDIYFHFFFFFNVGIKRKTAPNLIHMQTYNTKIHQNKIVQVYPDMLYLQCP